MKLLLDTHVLYGCFRTDSPSLSNDARGLLAAYETEMYFSSVSVAEISIKHSAHPKEMVLTGLEANDVFSKLGCKSLNFTPMHAAMLDSLPLLHRDPFDRMLIAQARAEGMKIMSHDRQFPQYGDFIIAV